MRLEGKVAVVTGAASGIGASMAVAFADAGMQVVVADIEEGAAEQVAGRLTHGGARALALGVDVASAASVAALADRCFEELGAVHVLCNNAGVLLMAPQDEMIPEDWSWTFSVNVLGVGYGLTAFLPRMRAQQEPCHVVNTASVTGLLGSPGMLVYGASKAAVISISEALKDELEDTPIGVSVLLPSEIRSNIVGSQRNRPAGAGRHLEPSVAPETAAQHGLDPAGVGVRVREAIERDEFYIFAAPRSGLPRLRQRIASRAQAMLSALEQGALPDEAETEVS